MVVKTGSRDPSVFDRGATNTIRPFTSENLFSLPGSIEFSPEATSTFARRYFPAVSPQQPDFIAEGGVRRGHAEKVLFDRC
jgi:hypothetical protein